MSWEPSVEDIDAARKQGDLKALLLLAAGLTPTKSKPAAAAEPEPPCYHIARPGAWPCGTAPSGPSPGPSCPNCATPPPAAA